MYPVPMRYGVADRPITRRLGLASRIFSMMPLTVGVTPWHSSITTAANSLPKRAMEFMTVPGVPNTTGCRRLFSPALAENMEHRAPATLNFSAFCLTSSALGARHRTCLPFDMAWMVSATAAMMCDFPAPVAASMQQGVVFFLIHEMMASWAFIWYGRRVILISHIVFVCFNTLFYHVNIVFLTYLSRGMRNPPRCGSIHQFHVALIRCQSKLSLQGFVGLTSRHQAIFPDGVKGSMCCLPCFMCFAVYQWSSIPRP